jgi:hypothetical protein
MDKLQVDQHDPFFALLIQVEQKFSRRLNRQSCLLRVKPSNIEHLNALRRSGIGFALLVCQPGRMRLWRPIARRIKQMYGDSKRKMAVKCRGASMVRTIFLFFVITASAALTIRSDAYAGGIQVNIGIPLVGYVAAPPVVAYPPPVVVERAPVVIEQPPPRVVYPQPVVVVEQAPRTYYYRPHKAKHYYKHVKHHRGRYCDYDD